MNSRFLPMGAALAPSLPGGPWKRAAQGQAVVDASWAMAADGKGGFDRHYLFGVIGGPVRRLGRPARWSARSAAPCSATPRRSGWTPSYPAFFLALLFEELRAAAARAASPLAGALIALALVPFAPPGIPVLAAALRARGRPERAPASPSPRPGAA